MADGIIDGYGIGSGNMEVKWEFTEYVDPDTDVKVTRLTPRGLACTKPYFYQRCFTSDGNRLLVCPALEEPALALLDIRTGVPTRVSFGPGVAAMGAFLSPDDRYVYFVRSRRDLSRIDLATGRTETVYRVSEGWSAYGTWSPNTVCDKVAAIELFERDADVGGAVGWDRFRALYKKKPRMRLLTIDLVSGRSRILVEESRFLGHPMYRPFDDSTIGFCHEGPHDLVTDRLWLINVEEPAGDRAEELSGDRATGVRPRLIYTQTPGEACTHEFWVPDGSRLVWVSYTADERGRSLMEARFDDRTGSIVCGPVMRIPPCAHLMADRSGTHFVGDGAVQLGDLETSESHDFSPDPYIYLFEPGCQSVTRVCRHDSSSAPVDGDTQFNHPHPVFTSDGKSIVFVSDRDGETAVYRADL